jgi:hypothetical protein
MSDEAKAGPVNASANNISAAVPLRIGVILLDVRNF